MKKILTVVCSICISVLSVVTTFAANIDITETSQGVAFEIQDIVDYVQAYGIRNDDALIRIPLKLSVEQEIETELLVEIEPSSISENGTLNINVSGKFYNSLGNVTLSVYGLSGSFEYTGTDSSITGKESYHNATTSGWSGTSKIITSKLNSYNISVLEGDYTLLKSKKEIDTAQIKIAVSQSGVYSVGGDYVSYNVN